MAIILGNDQETIEQSKSNQMEKKIPLTLTPIISYTIYSIYTVHVISVVVMIKEINLVTNKINA